MTAEKTKLAEHTTPSKERQFKGIPLSERKRIRREKLIEAGIQCYGTQGFFAVTVKDICAEAKLTERYFYESFKKSEALFHSIFEQLIQRLQVTIGTAILTANKDPLAMIDAGLNALLTTIKQDPRIARIIYIDAMLVKELHKQATLHEAMGRFDDMIFQVITALFPEKTLANANTSLVATGLNGYVTQVAIRWVTNGFKEPIQEVLVSCRVVFLSLICLLEQQQQVNHA